MLEIRRCREEMETTIVWNAAQRIAHIYTSDPAMLRKLDRMTAANPAACRHTWTAQDGTVKRYEVASNLVRISAPGTWRTGSQPPRRAARLKRRRMRRRSP